MDLNTIDFANISPDWTGSTRQERRIIQRIMKKEATPEAITCFEKYCKPLSDYWYWFILGTLWVSYTGYSDLELWKKLFQANRKNRAYSLMKPIELSTLSSFPDQIIAYRAHRENETDWIAYTVRMETAVRFAKKRKVDTIASYAIQKSDVLAYFNRRYESELLVLDKSKAEFVETIKLVYMPGA